MAAVIGVVGGHGGAGATAFAAALAGVAAPCLLVDLDPLGGGADVAVGIEAEPGVRWSGLHADGGRLDPGELVAALPSWGGVSVLACDAAPAAGAIAPVVTAARSVGRTVVDLGRAPSPARSVAEAECDALVLVAGADVRSVSAALAVRASIAATARWCGVVVRSGRGDVPAARLADLVELDLLGEVPDDPALRLLGRCGLDASTLRRPTVRLCRRVLEAVDVSTRRAAS